MHFLKLLISFILCCSMISCASTAVIRAMDANNKIDPDIEIYVDRQHIGKGEASYSDSKTVFSKVPFYELKKEGCQIIREKVDVKTNWKTSLGGSVILGVGLGIMQISDRTNNPQMGLKVGLPISIAGWSLLLWAREYIPVQEQNFQCIKISS